MRRCVAIRKVPPSPPGWKIGWARSRRVIWPMSSRWIGICTQSRPTICLTLKLSARWLAACGAIGSFSAAAQTSIDHQDRVLRKMIGAELWPGIILHGADPVAVENEIEAHEWRDKWRHPGDLADRPRRAQPD